MLVFYIRPNLKSEILVRCTKMEYQLRLFVCQLCASSSAGHRRAAARQNKHFQLPLDAYDTGQRSPAGSDSPVQRQSIDFGT
ncbi:jg2666 [Pararge aegeria aegeria]|uniref:Jg2666 protein n=1 Tax=Pararge aegeria aegeria TaxID=348720 RepID=A0A8S4QVS7_9NEOP|nr:jg2666 [Pararge aegeria aegeria]